MAQRGDVFPSKNLSRKKLQLQTLRCQEKTSARKIVGSISAQTQKERCSFPKSPLQEDNSAVSVLEIAIQKNPCNIIEAAHTTLHSASKLLYQLVNVCEPNLSTPIRQAPGQEEDRLRRKTSQVLGSINAYCHRKQRCRRSSENRKFLNMFPGETDRRDLSSILCQLGMLQYELGESAVGIRTYYQALEVEILAEDWDIGNVCAIMANIARISAETGDYSTALRLYQEIRSIQERTFGPYSPKTAGTLSNLAEVHYKTGHCDYSLKLHRRALEIYLSGPERHDLDVSASLIAIGKILFQKGDTQQALGCFISCYRVRRSLLGRSHYKVSVVLYNLAMSLFELGRTDQAISCYKETLRIEQIVLGPKHLDVANVLQHLGESHHSQGELKEALECYHRILDILRFHYRRDDMRVARILGQIANANLHLGRTSNAMMHISEANRISRSFGHFGQDITLSGFLAYAIAKLFPEGAAVA